MSGEVIPQEQIDTMFEAARWAPSSSNMQEWRYIYATKDDGADRATLESLLVEGNSWAKSAYLLIIAFADSKRTRSDGTMVDNPYGMHDTGAASLSLVLQATALGLVSHQMAGFDREKANELLGVPLQFVPASMIAVGKPADPSQLNEKQQEMEKAPRTRKAQCEFVFRGKWKI